MAWPAENTTIAKTVIVRIFIQVVGFPITIASSSPLIPIQHHVATVTRMPMATDHTLALATCDSPANFYITIRKCHFTPPIVNYTPPLTNVNSCGRIGVCQYLNSFGIQSVPLVNWNQPLVGGIFPILPFISYGGEGVI